jgi:hypothetical protein
MMETIAGSSNKASFFLWNIKNVYQQIRQAFGKVNLRSNSMNKEFIAGNSMEIIDKYWGALVCCPVFHKEHGEGEIVKYSNEIFTIRIGDVDSLLRATIHRSEFNKGNESWNVVSEMMHEKSYSISIELDDISYWLHKYRCMLDSLGIRHKI